MNTTHASPTKPASQIDAFECWNTQQTAKIKSVFVPSLKYFSAKSDSYVWFDGRCVRLTPEDDARFHTGFSQPNREPQLGISITRRQNGLFRFTVDLWRLDVRLRDRVVRHVESRWEAQASAAGFLGLSKSAFRRVLRRATFTNTLLQFETTQLGVDEWKFELAAILSDSDSYESLQPEGAAA